MAVTQEQFDNALNSAIKVNLTENDMDLIKSVTGMEELNAGNIRTALDSIYINGKNLTDMLG